MMTKVVIAPIMEAVLLIRLMQTVIDLIITLLCIGIAASVCLVCVPFTPLQFAPLCFREAGCIISGLEMTSPPYQQS